MHPKFGQIWYSKLARAHEGNVVYSKMLTVVIDATAQFSVT